MEGIQKPQRGGQWPLTKKALKGYETNAGRSIEPPVSGVVYHQMPIAKGNNREGRQASGLAYDGLLRGTWLATVEKSRGFAEGACAIGARICAKPCPTCLQELVC